MNNDIIRKMPFSMIAEQALLGSVLLDPESIRNVADTLSDSDFYVAEHQQIFAAMLRLFSTSNQYPRLCKDSQGKKSLEAAYRGG